MGYHLKNRSLNRHNTLSLTIAKKKKIQEFEKIVYLMNKFTI